MSRRVVRTPGRDLARRGAQGGGGRAIWIGQVGCGRERDRGAVDRVCDRVILDACECTGDAGDDELRVFPLV